MMSKYSPYILYLLIAVLVAVLFINNFGPIQSLQQSVNDLLCGLTAESGIRPNVVLITIDDKSQDEFGPWPWNHDLIADLAAATAAGEPKSIVLDFDLFEDAAQEAAGYTDVLAGQLSWMTQAVLPYDINLATYRSSKTATPDYLFKNSIQIDNPLGLMSEDASLLARKVFLPAERLLQYYPLMGFDYNLPDEDRVVRRQPMVVFFEGYYYPSLTLVGAASYLGVAPSEMRVIEGKEIQIGAARTIPIDRHGNFLVNFSKGMPFAHYSAAQVLSDDFNRAQLKNRLVLIGLPEHADNERFDTPVEPQLSETVIKATVLENIINDHIMAERRDLTPVILLVLLAAGGICAFVLPRLNLTYRLIILVGALVVLINVNYLMVASYGMLIPTAYMALELILFLAAAPMLDSRLLTGTEPSTAKAGKHKASAKAPRAVQRSAEPPVREIKSSPHDPENIATTALSASDALKAVSKIDHHTISLDEPHKRPDEGRPVAKKPAERTPATPDVTEDSRVAQSDGLSVSDDREESDGVRQDSQGILTDSDRFAASSPDIQHLGRYQINGVLGKGAMGTVYRGIDPAINRPVALKTIRLDFVSDPEEMAELRERLHREAHAAGKLSHPSIVTIYDVGSEGTLQYIAMEYLEGRTLEDMIKKKTRFNYRIIAQMISQICSALDYAHSQGIVHRDIKPANIMVLNDYRVKVMDFGIARVDSNSMTKTGIAMGTPNYISPEQLQGKEIDRRADLFSLGVVMYEMLLGRRPFKGENLTSLIYSILNHEPEKPSNVKPQIPLLFDHIISKALKKDRSQRYQKASEIMTDLQDFVESFVH